MSPLLQDGLNSQGDRNSVDGVGPMCCHPLLGASPDAIICHCVRGVPRHLANALLLPAAAAVHTAPALNVTVTVHAATAVHVTEAVPVSPEKAAAGTCNAGVETAAEAAAAAPVGGSPDPLGGDRVVRLLGEVLSRVVYAGAMLQQQAPSISGAEQDDVDVSSGDEAAGDCRNDADFCDISSDGGAEDDKDEEEDEDGNAQPGSIPAAIPLTSWVPGSSAAAGPLPGSSAAAGPLPTGAEAPVSSTAQLQLEHPATGAGPLMMSAAEVDQHTIHALSSPFCVIALNPARCGERKHVPSYHR